MTYRLIYPDGDVTLTDLTRAALAECGAEHVSIVSGMGSQVVRVLDECADRVMHRAGLASEDAPAEAPAPKTASAPEEDSSESPGADAPTVAASTKAAPSDDDDESTPGRPAGRAAGRPAAKTTARRTTPRRKEG